MNYEQELLKLNDKVIANNNKAPKESNYCFILLENT